MVPRGMDTNTTERWLTTTVGALTLGLAVAVVAVYAWGRSIPEQQSATASAEFAVAPQRIWEVLGDPARRSDWRPRVDRVGRIDDDAEGRPVWRELAHDEDRFDFRIDAREPGRRITIAIAAPDQIGIAGGWDYRIEPSSAGSRLSVTETRRIANPLWRGMFHLRRDSHATVDQELDMLANFLGTEIRIEHR